MNTKTKGDIAEQAVKLKALLNNWNVLDPVGDRLPYDLVFEIDGKFVRIQIKSAWFNQKAKNYVVDTRRSQTNQRSIKRKPYCSNDFDFAIIYIDDLDIFYIIPVKVFISYKSTLSIVEIEKRQRKAKSAKYREAWNLITKWTVNTRTC